MEYIVLGRDGKEYGPIDADTLKKWVEHDRVFKDTKVRNSLMKKWNDAGSLDFLQEAFELQVVHEEEEQAPSAKLVNVLGFGQKKEPQAKQKEKSTAFVQRYIPNPASVGQRVGAFIIDAFLIVCFAGLLFIVMNIQLGTTDLGEFSIATPQPDIVSAVEDESSQIISAAEKAKKNDTVSEQTAKNEKVSPTNEPGGTIKPTQEQIDALNSAFYKYFAIFLAGVLLYYSIGLGIYAQTVGMWYWGLIIVKGYNEEALPLQAFAYTLAMFAIGIITPVFVLLNPAKRSLHGYLTGARIICTAAKPKA